MRRLNTNYNIDVEVVSPLFIGGNQEKNWVRGIDFVHYKGEIYVLDNERLYLDLDEQAQEKYYSYLSKARFLDLERFICEEIDPEEYAMHIYGYKQKLPSNEIKNLIRDGKGKPYIPGSSIKGALSSIILGYLAEQKNMRIIDDKSVHQLIGNFSESIFRFIRPYDCTCDDTEISDIELFNLNKRGGDWYSDYKEDRGTPFIVTMENFAPKAKGQFRLSIADGLAERIDLFNTKDRFTIPHRNYYSIIKNNPIEFLFEIINTQTRKHIDRELLFFEEYDEAEGTDLIVENLQKWKEITQENKNTCLLRVGGGIGFHAITGEHRFWDHLETIDNPDQKNLIYNFRTRQREPARYKSRKVATANFELMGYLKMSVA
jgi:CRISPR-associated protein Csm5